MKVLVMYVKKFSYSTSQKNMDEVESVEKSDTFEDAILAFIQVEESDEERDVKSREKKLVNHLKWTSRKNNTKRIVLHSFAHLGESKASFDFTKELLDLAEIRLKNADFETAQTPLGYFLDLDIQAPGFSLARIWATL